MSKAEDQRSAARQKAEEQLTKRKREESERLAARDRDNRVEDEKTARLRGLRLAKEAADRNAALLAAHSLGKKADKTT